MGFAARLPVLDDFGQVIPEDSIQLTMRPPQVRAFSLLAVAGLGALVFNGLRPQPPRSADCSIYEPCTPREEFYKSRSALIGAVVGFMVGGAIIPDRGIDRWQAVEILRARRRFVRQSTTPP